MQEGFYKDMHEPGNADQSFKSTEENFLIWWFVGASFLCIITFYLSFIPFNSDVAALLHISGRMLEGANLYVDILELNPPLICYFGIPPVWLARLLGLPETFIFSLYIILLGIVSLVFCFPVLERSFGPNRPLVRRALFFIIVFVSLVYPLPIFGQREHFLIILILPYLLSALIPASDKPLHKGFTIAIGTMAGIGFMIKPFFLMVWIAVEGYQWFKARILFRRRVFLNLVILLVVVLLALVIIWFESDYFRLIPLLKATYFAYQKKFIHLFKDHTAMFFALVGVLTFLIRLPDQDRHNTRILFLASAVLLLTAVLQRKWWPNHMYPCFVTTFFLFALITFRLVEETRDLEKRLWKGMFGCVLVFFLVASAYMVRSTVREYRVFTRGAPLPHLLPLAKAHARGKPLYTITTSGNSASFPLVNYSGALWPYHFYMLWPLPAQFRPASKTERKLVYTPLEKMNPIERWVVETVVSDLVSHPPVLLIVDIRKEKPHIEDVELDFLKYFSLDKRFAELIKSYSCLGEFEGYAVYKRQQ